MIRKLWISITILGTAHVAWAYRGPLEQKSIPTFTLTDVVALAIRNNPTLKQAKLSRITQKLALLAAKDAFYPQYTLKANYGYTNTENGQSYARSGSVTPTIALKNHYGTSFSINGTNPFSYDHPNEDGGLNPFTSATYSPTLTFSMTQELMKGFGKAVVDATLNQAKDTELTNKLEFQASAVTAIDAVINDYFNVIESKLTIQVDIQTEKNYEKTVENDRLYIKAGQKSPADIVQAQASLASQKVTVEDDTNTLNINKQTLLDDIGVRSDYKFVLPSDLNNELKKDEYILTGGKKFPDLKDSEKYAVKNNITYQTAIYTLRGLARDLMSEKDAIRPDLALTVSRQQGGEKDEDTGITSLFDGNNSETSVNLNLTVPIDSFANKQGLVNAKVALENGVTSFDEAKRDLYSDVQQALNTLKSDKEQVTLSQKALALQRENVNVANKMHEVGRTSTFEYVSKQEMLFQSETDFVKTKIGYLEELVTFNQELNLTLNRWNIKLEY